MANQEQMLITIDSDYYRDAEFSTLSRRKQGAAISAATDSIDNKIQEWFKQHGHECSTRTLNNIGNIFIGCTPQAAEAFEQAVSDNQIPGVTSVLRNAQDVVGELIKPVGESHPIDKLLMETDPIKGGNRTRKSDMFGYEARVTALLSEHAKLMNAGFPKEETDKYRAKVEALPEEQRHHLNKLTRVTEALKTGLTGRDSFSP